MLPRYFGQMPHLNGERKNCFIKILMKFSQKKDFSLCAKWKEFVNRTFTTKVLNQFMWWDKRIWNFANKIDMNFDSFYNPVFVLYFGKVNQWLNCYSLLSVNSTSIKSKTSSAMKVWQSRFVCKLLGNRL